MLPPELITLLLLATTSIALPQNEPQANVTVSTTAPISDTTVDPSISIPPPSDPTDDPGDLQEPPPWIDPCGIESCTPVNLIPELPTATGWEDDNNNIQQPTVVGPPKQSDRVIVTTRPTIIGITTNTQPRETRPPSSDDPKTRPSGGGPNANGDNMNPAPTGQDSLLENIVSGLGDAPGRAQAQSAAQAPVTPAPGASETQATATVGGVITAGEVPLTLTPGLSTTIGVETDATFIGITTNTAGQTVITISSSGTAVTATVTDAPLTVTLPKTGFEASITNAARPGQWSSSAVGTAASTSSRGGAVGQQVVQNWRMGAVMGVLGAVVAM